MVRSARVVLDVRNLTDVPNGVGQYGKFLIPQLVALAPEWDFTLIRHVANRALLFEGHQRVTEVFEEGRIGTFKDWVTGSRMLERVFRQTGPPDLYHNLFHVSPLGLPQAGAWRPKEVVTLHDVIWIDHALASQGRFGSAAAMNLYARASIPRTLRRADHVVCVSEWTRQRALDWVEPKKTTTIPHGVDARFFERYPRWVTEGRFGAVLASGTPYVVAVGNDKPYKNLGLLVRAFARALPRLKEAAHLVLVGRCEGLWPLVRSLGIEDAVSMLGFLEQEALCQVVAHAGLFVFPSKVEGFGAAAARSDGAGGADGDL